MERKFLLLELLSSLERSFKEHKSAPETPELMLASFRNLSMCSYMGIVLCLN